jgi:hypothetical protein
MLHYSILKVENQKLNFVLLDCADYTLCVYRKEFIVFPNTVELRENTDLETKENKTSLRISQHIFA